MRLNIIVVIINEVNILVYEVKYTLLSIKMIIIITYCSWGLIWRGMELQLLLFPHSSRLCVTGAWAGAGYGRWGLWLGCG